MGCSALSVCPRLSLMSAEAEAPVDGPAGPEQEPEYRSPFGNWFERASVRQAPRRMVVDDGTQQYFSPDLVPVAGHPLVKALDGAHYDELLVQHLYRYLDFTAKLEYLVVNPVLLRIAHGTDGMRLPAQMRFDALKMYCDEAYHGLFSVDLTRQVEERTGIVPRTPVQPFFLRRLKEITEELPAEERGLAELLFVIISETLISASLAEVPAVDGVVSAVRETIRDHALDEGRHHAYFAAFLKYLWGTLTPRQRHRAGLLVPRLMHAFLHPDMDALREELAGYGMPRDDVEQVLAEVFTPAVLSEHALATSRQTRHYFELLGACSSAEAVEELVRYGFV
ncbi:MULTISPECIES: diiron oxygenase [Streptomyces]|uniref:Diiron oxygenase n=2 Tax=Streptomyces TaxID=1883 RepID=A0ABU4K3M2_9ACTN|nr:diiron oxygenase [Streptomyces roseolus]MDX2292338.1 diiron oxygenase [Streptomyces roseolus]